jgi:hypothetical protein
MQRSRHQDPNGDGPAGIRAGVWIAVLVFSLACLLLIAVLPPPAKRINPELTSRPEGEWRSNSAMRLTPGARPVLRRSDTVFDPGRDLWFPAPQSAEEAARLACDAANQKAKELYNCKPFSHERPALMVDGRWVWSDSRGQGKADVEATVEFAVDGSLQSVDVLWLDSAPERF